MTTEHISTWLVASVIIVLGSWLQSVIGFGLALLAAPLLYMLEPELLPVPVIYVGFFLSILNTYRFRKNLHIAGLGWAVVGRVPGTLMAIMALRLASSAWIAIGLGVMVLLAVAVSRLAPPISPNKKTLFWAGLASGFMGTSSSIGGPPMALLYQHEKGDVLRAQLSAYFILGSAMSLVGLLLAGYVTWPLVWWALSLSPAAVLGYILAQFTLGRGNDKWLNDAVLWICGLSAITVMAKGIMQL